MSRVSVEYRSTEREVYDRFCKVNPDIIISYKEWVEVLYTFNYSFRDHLLETGDKIKMPHGMGSFAISKKKTEKFKIIDGKTYINLPVDWKKSKAAGKKIYNFNSHTDGYKFKWFWFVGESRFYQSDIWNFKPARVTSRLLADYINNRDKANTYKQWDFRKF